MNCAPWCEAQHGRADTECLCIKRIVATHDVDGEPVTIIVERLAEADDVFIVEALAPLSLSAVYELTAALIDAGRLVHSAAAA